MLQKQWLLITLTLIASAGCNSKTSPECSLQTIDQYVQLPDHSDAVIISAARITYSPIPLPEQLLPVRFILSRQVPGEITLSADLQTAEQSYAAPKRAAIRVPTLRNHKGCEMIDTHNLTSLVNSNTWYSGEPHRETYIQHEPEVISTFHKSHLAGAMASVLFTTGHQIADSEYRHDGLMLRLEFDDMKTQRPKQRQNSSRYHYQHVTKTGDGSTESKDIFWPINKKMHLTVSNGFPRKFERALTAAIAYWNSALGQNIITWDRTSKPIDILDPKINAIQWLEWPSGEYSYADVRFDPTNGEIQQAAMYLASSMFASGMQEVSHRLAVSGGERHAPSMCKKTGKINPYIGNSPSLELQEQLLEDQAASLIAHELGHMLGLRHNYAASLDTGLLAQDLPILVEKILTGNHADVDHPASSVMDYAYHEIDLLIGRHVRKRQTALDFDQEMGRHWAQGNAETESMYCNEDDVLYADCSEFDSFGKPLLSNVVEYEFRIDQMIEKIVLACVAFMDSERSYLDLNFNFEEHLNLLESYVDVQVNRMQQQRFLYLDTKYPDPFGMDAYSVEIELEQDKAEVLQKNGLGATNIIQIFQSPPTDRPDLQTSWKHFLMVRILEQMPIYELVSDQKRVTVLGEIEKFSNAFSHKWINRMRKKISSSKYKF